MGKGMILGEVTIEEECLTIANLKDKIELIFGEDELLDRAKVDFLLFIKRDPNLQNFASEPDLKSMRGAFDQKTNIRDTRNCGEQGLLYTLGRLFEGCVNIEFQGQKSSNLVSEVVCSILAHTVRVLGNKRYFMESSDIEKLGVVYNTLSTLVVRGLDTTCSAIRHIADIIFYRFRFDISSRDNLSKLGVIYESFFGDFYVKLGIGDRKQILRYIASILGHGELLITTWDSATLISPLVSKALWHCEDHDEIELMYSIVSSLASYNLTVIDMKHILFALRHRVKKSCTSLSTNDNTDEDPLKGSNYLVNHNEIEFDTQNMLSGIVQCKKFDTFLPLYFDMLLNLLYNISIPSYSSDIYSLYMSGDNSGVAMQLIPDDSRDEINNLPWTCCFWIKPILPSSDLNEYDILHIETAPSNYKVIVSIHPLKILFKYSGKVCEIQCDLTKYKWKMLTVTREFCDSQEISSDMSCYKLSMYIDDTLVWCCMELLEEVIFIHSIYLCMSDIPSEKSEPSKIFKDFTGLLGFCMFSLFSVSCDEVKRLYKIGPDHFWIDWRSHLDYITNDNSNNNLRNKSQQPIRSNYSIVDLYPRKILYNINNLEPVFNRATFIGRSLADISTGSQSRHQSGLDMNVFKYTTESNNVIMSPYRGAVCEIYNSLSYRSSLFSTAIKAMGGTKVLVSYLEDLDKSVVPDNNKDDSNLDTKSDLTKVKLSNIEGSNTVIQTKERVCLLFRLIISTLDDPVSCRIFFESSNLSVIHSILVINAKSYMCVELIKHIFHLVKLTKKYKLDPSYVTLIETSLLFSYPIWSQLSPENSEACFVLLKSYIDDEILFVGNQFSPQIISYLVLITSYLQKSIFFCRNYIQKLFPNLDESWQESNFLPIANPRGSRNMIIHATDVLRDLLLCCRKHDINTFRKYIYNLIIPEDDTSGVNEYIGILLRRLILWPPPVTTANMIELIFECCDIYVLFEICIKSYSLTALVLEIIYFMSKSVNLTKPCLLMAKELYICCSPGINLKRAKKRWMSHYLLLHSSKSYDINENLAYSLVQLAFGITLIDARTGKILSKEAYANAKFTPSKVYINLLLHTLRTNKDTNQIKNVLWQIFNTNPESLRYFNESGFDHLYEICSLLVNSDAIAPLKTLKTPFLSYFEPPSTLGELTKYWIIANLSNTLSDNNHFYEKFQSVVFNLYCIYRTSTASTLYDFIIKSLITIIPLKCTIPNSFKIFLYLSRFTLIVNENKFIDDISSKFTKLREKYSLPFSSIFQSQNVNWNPVYHDKHITDISTDYICGLRDIILSRYPSYRPSLNNQTPFLYNISDIFTMIIEHVTYSYSSMQKIDYSLTQNIEKWFEVTSTYMCILEAIITTWGPENINKIDYALDLVMKHLLTNNETNPPQYDIIRMCMIGLADILLSNVRKLPTNTHTNKIEELTLKIALIYTKLLTFTEDNCDNYKRISFNANPQYIKDALSGELYGMLNLLSSDVWKSYLSRTIHPEINKTLCATRRFCTVLNNNITNTFSMNAQTIYANFLVFAYDTHENTIKINKYLEPITDNRAKMLTIALKMDIDIYANSRIEKLNLYRKVFCESGIWTGNDVNWAVDPREYDIGIRKRLMPKWGIVKNEQIPPGITIFGHNTTFSDTINFHSHDEWRNYQLAASRIKSKLSLTSSKDLNIASTISSQMSSSMKNLLLNYMPLLGKIWNEITVQYPLDINDGNLRQLGYNKLQYLPFELSKSPITSVNCEYIFASYSVKGTLKVTEDELIFTQDAYTGVTGIYDNTDFMIMTQLLFSSENFFIRKKWRINDINRCFSRRYILRQSALEFFFSDKKSCLFNFPSSTSNDPKTSEKTLLLNTILSVRPELSCNVFLFNDQKFSVTLESFTNMWVHGKISNFEYLMHLNMMSGRTYNDFTQYPVFPWIISDYESETIDLEDERIYRDLTKPVGALNEERLKNYISRFENFEDTGNNNERSFYGTHYSSAAAVVFYLMRIEPYASVHRYIQGGNFDSPDRLFYSLKNCWKSVQTSTYDVKELIPEFFYMPEFLINKNKYDFGKLQNGAPVNDVMLPKWARTPHEFVRINNMALESRYTSSNLHHWIDLIWGYKQTGKEAVKAYNTFNYLTYEGSIDIDSLEDESKKKSIISQITHFGQTPPKLFTSAHPAKISASETIESHPFDPLALSSVQYINKKRYANGIMALHPTFSYVDLNRSESFTTPHMAESSSFMSLLDKTISLVNFSSPPSVTFEHALYIVYDNCYIDLLCIGKSLYREPTVSLQMTIELDLDYLALNWIDNGGLQFKFSPNGNFLAIFRIWDGCFLVIDMRSKKQKTSNFVRYHNDVVNNVCFSEDETTIYTCSKDLKIYSWNLESIIGGDSPTPLNEYIGQTDSIETLCCDNSLDILLSSSENSKIIMHSCLDARYMYSLIPSKHSNYKYYNIPTICTTKKAYFAVHVVYKNHKCNSNNKVISTENNSQMHEVSLYNINGLLISSRYFSSPIEVKQMIYSKSTDRILLLLNSSILTLSNESLEDLNSLDLPGSIDFVSPSLDDRVLFLYKKDGTIAIMQSELIFDNLKISNSEA